MPTKTRMLLCHVAVAAVAPRPILLIHIPKTGGDSIIKSIGLGPDRETWLTEECANVPVTLTLHERHAVAADARLSYPKDVWEHSYKIAFVRNPWARMVSSWAFLTYANQTVPEHAPPDPQGDANSDALEQCGCGPHRVRKLAKPSRLFAHVLQPSSGPGSVGASSASTASRACSKKALCSAAADDPSVSDESYYCSFSHFVKNCVLDGGGMEEIRQPELAWVVSNESGATVNTSLDRGSVLVDFVGRQENLEAHLATALVNAGEAGADQTAEGCADEAAGRVHARRVHARCAPSRA